MIITIIVVLVFLILSLAITGFKCEPPNPYLILIAGILCLLVGAGILTGGVEVINGSSLNLNTSNDMITGTVTDTYDKVDNLRINSLAIIFILMSLYFCYYAIGDIIHEKYG